MSHFTKVNTQIKELALLKRAIETAGFTCVDAQGELIKIKGWNHDTADVLMEIKTTGPYSIGVIQNNETGTFEFVADWWGVETYNEITKEDFLNTITQKYAYNTIMDKIKEKGFNIVSDETDNSKHIHIVVRRWN